MKKILFRVFANNQFYPFTFNLPQGTARSSLTEYIGIEDINGVAVYEGDILQDNDGVIYRVDYFNSSAAFMLRATDGSIISIQDLWLKSPTYNGLRIIGNKFQSAHKFYEKKENDNEK